MACCIEFSNGRHLCIPDDAVLMTAIGCVAVAVLAWAILEIANTLRPSSGNHDHETARLWELSRKLDEEAARDDARLRAALQRESMNFEELFRRVDEESEQGRGG